MWGLAPLFARGDVAFAVGVQPKQAGADLADFLKQGGIFRERHAQFAGLQFFPKPLGEGRVGESPI